MKPSRIGLLGGTFNPVHQGHLHIAQEVLQRLKLDEVRFIPSETPPHKNSLQLASAKDRLEMLRLALLHRPCFKICNIELKHPGPSYTVETLQRLREQHLDEALFFIIGMDAFSAFISWKEPALLLEICHFAILSRPGFPFVRLPRHRLFNRVEWAMLQKLDAGLQDDYAVSVSRDRWLHFMKIIPSGIAASDIRRDFSRGLGGRKRLPRSVESYIIEHKIY